MVKTIKGLNSAKKAVGSGSKVVIKFFAPWCGACKQVEGLYKKFSQKYPNVKFYQVNIDDNPDLTKHYSVKFVPTFFFYKDMQLSSKVGGSDVNSITKSMEEL